MKTNTIQLLLLLILLPLVSAVYTKCAFGQSWQPVSSLPTNGQTRFIAVHPEKSFLSFLAAQGNLYASSNDGKDWKQVLGLGTETEIFDLYFDHDRIFLLTSDGLFESKNDGRKWKKIFSGLQGEKSVRSLTPDPSAKNILYLGTNRGMFVSRDGGRKWEKMPHMFDRHLINQLKIDAQNNEVFVATDQGLYRMMPNRNRLDRIYVMRTAASLESLENENLEEDLEKETPSTGHINTVLVTPSSDLTLATENGILISEDEGNYWERLPDGGLPKAPIIDLAYSHLYNTFIAATETAVFTYIPNEKRWKEIPSGFQGQKIKRLTLVSAGETEILYAATQNSVFRIIIDSSLFYPDDIRTFSAERWNLLNGLIHNEPNIGTVQKQAIRYANVNKLKTKRWQWASRAKALVPSLSVGKNYSTGNTVDIDRGSTNEPDQYIIGPEDINRSWDFDLNWELSDLIWNTAQTSIDSREKLMVELRDDILSEVTRLYYERRRAQIEFVLRTPADSFDYANALLRIDELTAQIDALTDGFLTKQLDLIYSKYPKFQTLWTLYEAAPDSKTV